VRQAREVIPNEEAGQRSARANFRPDIEGLRAVAVLAVVLFHAHVPGIDGGFVGVDVFFVISGFLITGLLWREVSSTGTVSLRGYYGARARRLLPASAFVGIFIMVSAAFLLPPLQSRDVMASGIASALYVSNYWFARKGVDYLAALGAPSPFQHYWSLAVEEQFYLVWPALIIATAWIIRRSRRGSGGDRRAPSSKRPYLIVLAMVTAASFALSIVLTNLIPPVAFFSLPTRAWQLAAGGLVALTASEWSRLSPRTAAVTGWFGLGAIALACTQLSAATMYPGTAALLPTLGTVLVIGAGCANPSQGCGRLLGLSPMRAIGRVSYSWYLWHWPILLLALWSIAPVTGHAPLLALAGVLLSLGLAALTLRFIENPLRYAAPVRRSAGRSLALGGVATAMAVVTGIVLYAPNPVGRGAPAPTLTIVASPPPAGSPMGAYDAAVRSAFGQVRAAVAASANLRAVPSNLFPQLDSSAPMGDPTHGCFRSFFQVGQPECATGDTTSPMTVALIGDSNAQMWNPAFKRAAEQQHWRLETMTRAGCPMLELPINNPMTGRRYTECETWRAEIVARLRAEPPRLVVVSMMRRYGARFGWDAGSTSYESPWIDSLTRLAQELRGTGTQVLVLGPVPDPGSQVPLCLASNLDDASACAPPRSDAVNEPGINAESAATEAGGGQYVDVSDLFCTPDRCPAIVGNTLVYFDQNHMTAEYSRVLAPVVGALAARALANASQ
jgi:hypothetical protein